jgi:hypothetical protein
VYLVKPVVVFIPSILTMAVTHPVVLVAPSLKATVESLLVGIDQAPC